MNKAQDRFSYFNRRSIVILLLGFTSGIPLALVGSVLQGWFKHSGVDIVTIGCLGLVGQPYLFKFLWAPLMDRFELPFLGRRRGWILVAQLGIILAILIMALQEPSKTPLLVASVAMVLAFFAASHDIVIDAYRVDILLPIERGWGAALAAEGYRLGMIISSGGALILADHLGWQKTYLLMAVLVTIGIFAVAIATEPKTTIPVAKTMKTIIVENIQDFFKRPFAFAFLGLIILYKLGDAFSQALSTAFLLDMDFSLTAVGTINKGVGLMASLIGIILGGIIMVRLNLFKSLLTFAILQAVTNLGYMALALIGKNYLLAIMAFALECLCSGMGSAALAALLMTLCNSKFTATQFALLSSLTAFGRVYVSPIAGMLVKNLGWAKFYGLTFFLAIPGILLLLYLRLAILSLLQNSQAIAKDVVNTGNYDNHSIECLESY